MQCQDFELPPARALKPDAVTTLEPNRTGAFRVCVGNWDELGADASGLRTLVFVQEQQIPIEMEWDEADAGATHAVAYDAAGQALATGRLLVHAPGVARIGRMAVRRELRGAGLGSVILRALVACARRRGEHEVMLHAQRSAEGFYTGLGFVVSGAPFDEAGIAHIEMRCATACVP